MAKVARRSLNEFQTPLGVIKEEHSSNGSFGVKGVLQVTDPQAALSIVRKSRTQSSGLVDQITEEPAHSGPRPPYCVECKQYLHEFSDPSAQGLTGYLNKKRSVQRRLSFKMWKQRYFRLVGGHLAYYEDQEAAQYSLPNGVMHLDGCFVSCPGLASGFKDSSSYELELRVARRSLSSDSTWSIGSGSEREVSSTQPQHAVYLLKAQTEQDLQLWVEALSRFAAPAVPALSRLPEEKLPTPNQLVPRLPSSSSSFSLAARSRLCEQCAASGPGPGSIDLDAFTLAEEDGFLLWLQKDIDPALSSESDWTRVWAVCARRHLALFASPEDVPCYKPIVVLHLRDHGIESIPPAVGVVPLELTEQRLSEIRRRSQGASSLSRLNLHLQLQLNASRDVLPGWAFEVVPASPAPEANNRLPLKLVFRTESPEAADGHRWMAAMQL